MRYGADKTSAFCAKKLTRRFPLVMRVWSVGQASYAIGTFAGVYAYVSMPAATYDACQTVAAMPSVFTRRSVTTSFGLASSQVLTSERYDVKVPASRRKQLRVRIVSRRDQVAQCVPTVPGVA